MASWIQRVTFEIAKGDRGYAIIETQRDGAGADSSGLTIIEGTMDSGSIRDRVRKHVTGRLRELFPDARRDEAAARAT